MSTHSALQTAPVDSLAYAQSLYDYADQRLDAFSLRSWIIQRLMHDDGLEHECAEEAFEHVLASTLKADGARDSRETHRERGRTSTREIRSSANRWTRRHVRPHRSTGPACA
jgi:hypothetical protein